MSALKLEPKTLKVLDYFAPYNTADLSSKDLDFGTAEPVVFNGPGNTPLLATIDKTGEIYILNRDNLGGFSAVKNNIFQEIPSGKEIKNNMVYFDSGLYIGQNDKPLTMYKFESGKFNLNPASLTKNSFGNGLSTDGQGTNPEISANGVDDGIVWALDNSNFINNGPAVLYAYDAGDLSKNLFDSSAKAANQSGPAVKFSAPVAANGKVFVPGVSQITVYGLAK
jgi:hypothetical protein